MDHAGRLRVDRSRRLDGTAAFPGAPHIAGDDAGERRRLPWSRIESEPGEIDVQRGEVGLPRPRRGERIARHLHREVDPAGVGRFERPRDPAPVTGASEMKRHPFERHRAEAVPLVDPDDARGKQRQVRLVQHPPRETGARTRSTGRVLPESGLGDRERSVGPLRHDERRASGGDLPRTEGARAEQVEQIDGEGEIGEPERCVRRRVGRDLAPGEPHVPDSKHRRPAAPVGIDGPDLDLPVGGAAQPLLDLRPIVAELRQQEPQPHERDGREHHEARQQVRHPAHELPAGSAGGRCRWGLFGAHGPALGRARRCVPPRRSGPRSGRPTRPPRLIVRSDGKPRRLRGSCNRRRWSTATGAGVQRGLVTSGRRRTARASTGSRPAA